MSNSERGESQASYIASYIVHAYASPLRTKGLKKLCFCVEKYGWLDCNEMDGGGVEIYFFLVFLTEGAHSQLAMGLINFLPVPLPLPPV